MSERSRISSPQQEGRQRQAGRPDSVDVASIMDAYGSRPASLDLSERLPSIPDSGEATPIPPTTPHVLGIAFSAPAARSERPYSPLVDQHESSFSSQGASPRMNSLSDVPMPVPMAKSVPTPTSKPIQQSTAGPAPPLSFPIAVNEDEDEDISHTSTSNLLRPVSKYQNDSFGNMDDSISYYLDPTDESIREKGTTPIHEDIRGIVTPYMQHDEDNRSDPDVDRQSMRTPDMDSILSEYARHGSMTPVLSMYKRRPTNPETPNFDRHGLRLYRHATDSRSSIGAFSVLDEDDEDPIRHMDGDSPVQRARWRGKHDIYSGTAADTSMVSLADMSSEHTALPADYRTLALVNHSMIDWVDADKDWDDKRMSKMSYFSWRACTNVSMLLILALSVLMLFLGYPVLHTYTIQAIHESNHFGNVSPNSSIPTTFNATNLRQGLIDPDTPPDKYERINIRNQKTMKLVFSDDFNTPGRSFYPGEDPFWQAEDLHYWQTMNYEWYDPDSVYTEDGDLVIRFAQKPEHGLFFRGGMISSWNKFCFTGGYMEVKLQLPGFHNVSGLWPAVWTMGNLGRAGYGASTEGMWPYSYDTCDVGTMPNQTYLPSQGGGPLAAETSGRWVDQYGPSLSFLPGQRLSRCTCLDSDDHPGPRHPDGTWVGRSAPEIDLLEATANNGADEHGQLSMSLQIAPFDTAYNASTEGDALVIYPNLTRAVARNDYTGAAFQQAVSVMVNTSDTAYQHTGQEYDTYAFLYEPGSTLDSHITWFVNNEPKFTVNTTALGPNPETEIGQRTMPEEPMYVIMNLGMSPSFQWVNWDELRVGFPFKLRVDYIRIYQDEDKITPDSLSCDPTNFPTKAYIEKHKEAYTNSQFTSWLQPADKGGYNHPFPGNVLLGQCS